MRGGHHFFVYPKGGVITFLVSTKGGSCVFVRCFAGSYHPPPVEIMNGPLKQVESFIYLGHVGGTISQKGSCTEDIKSRIGKALGAVQRLQPIWKAEDIQQDTKVELYRVIMLSILLYGTETWTSTLKKENKTDSFSSKWCA